MHYIGLIGIGLDWEAACLLVCMDAYLIRIRAHHIYCSYSCSTYLICTTYLDVYLGKVLCRMLVFPLLWLLFLFLGGACQWRDEVR